MSEQFVPIEEVSKHFSVSISTIRAWIRQQHIPKSAYLKVGNTYRFRISDVTNALKPEEESVDFESLDASENTADLVTEAFTDEDI
jgi:excisionase family DNA binding protein|tara:strand:- start:2555 stop:2812 length:258 start_codon:yes stop_codon:yes gene_type:complete